MQPGIGGRRGKALNRGNEPGPWPGKPIGSFCSDQLRCGPLAAFDLGNLAVYLLDDIP